MVWHQFGDGLINTFGILGNLTQQRAFTGLQTSQLYNTGFSFNLAKDTTRPGMGVLQIWAAIAFDGNRFFGIKNEISADALLQESIFDRTHDRTFVDVRILAATGISD